MKEVEIYIKEKILEAVRKTGFNPEILYPFELTVCKQKEHGDLTTNVAFILASREKKNPKEIANKLLETMEIDENWVSRAEVAGAGFINFVLNLNCLLKSLREILELGNNYGKTDWGNSKNTQVEFVSANPTGPLTVGHGRQAVLGDTIARLLEVTGHRVTREYYFNDAGRQMQILGDSVRLRYKELLGESVDFPDDYYQGEYIIDIARNAVEEKGVSLRDSDEIDYFKNLAEKLIFEDIKKTLTHLDVNFDVYYNEKSLYETGEIDSVVRELRG